MKIPKTGQPGSVGLLVTKTLVVLGDPLSSFMPSSMLEAQNGEPLRLYRGDGRLGFTPHEGPAPPTPHKSRRTQPASPEGARAPAYPNAQSCWRVRSTKRPALLLRVGKHVDSFSIPDFVERIEPSPWRRPAARRGGRSPLRRARR